MAGVYTWGDDRERFGRVHEAIRDRLAHLTDVGFREYLDESMYAAKVDLGAFRDSGWEAGERELRVVVGDPVPDGAGAADLPRTALFDLHGSPKGESGPERALRMTRGVYSFCRYHRPTRRLEIGTDKLGVRPVYYWIGPDLLVFSNSLRLLEQIAEVPKRLSVRGIIETTGFGYPLATRSAYADIRRLHAAELLTIADGRVGRSRYWKWAAEGGLHSSPTDAAAEAYARFREGVVLRLHGDRRASAFLSGGLDSRAVAGTLVDLGVEVEAYTFARGHSQDKVFAQAFATAAGIRQHLRPLPQGEPRWSEMIAEQLRSRAQAGDRVFRVWSGDGGSVGTGHVYLTPRLVSMMSDATPEAVCREYFRSNGIAVSRRLFRRRIVRIVDPVLAGGAVDELNGIQAREPGRRFHLFLMLSDQRHHLNRHFETLLDHRIELVLPFFDSRFLETVLAVPVEECLGHRFYYKWLEHFPDAVRSVPWQAYPGHLPCPVPWAEELPTQWQTPGKARGSSGARDAARGLAISLRRAFPGDILRRSVLGAATLLTASRIAAYPHIVKAGLHVYEHWIRAGGRTVLDWPPSDAA